LELQWSIKRGNRIEDEIRKEDEVMVYLKEYEWNIVLDALDIAIGVVRQRKEGGGPDSWIAWHNQLEREFDLVKQKIEWDRNGRK
jgi:hypothetical protein